MIHAPSPVPGAVEARIALPKVAPLELLLFEPQFLLRRTVAAVARDMRLAHPNEVTTIEAAMRMVTTQSFDALFLSLDEEGPALELMSHVRNGDTTCAVTIPIAVTAAACNTSLALRLKNLEVRRLLLRPFKVKNVLEAIVALRQSPMAPSEPPRMSPASDPA